MPSLSKLIAWSAVAAAVYASAMPEPEAGDGISSLTFNNKNGIS